METIKKIKIFISCPDDIISELDSIKLIVEEINKTSGKHNSYFLETLNWKTDTYTQIGSDPQDVINNQIEGKYDILVGLLWLKIGTPTKRDKSGTIEEINQSLSDKKTERLIYFSTIPPENLTLINTDQLSKINSFKEELTSKGVLYKEYNSIRSFENQFRINLVNLIVEKIISQTHQMVETIPKEIEKSNYSSITELINEVENKDENIPDLDIINLTEDTTSSLNIITASLISITKSLNSLTDNLSNRTQEFKTFIKIKDNRLRISKIRKTANLLADELDDFNISVNLEIPKFAENMTNVGQSYSKLILFTSSLNNEDDYDISKSAINFRDSLEAAMKSNATLLRAVMNWPPINSKFNKSKRDTELTLKNLTKELLEGLLLLDEAIKNILTK